MKKIWKYINKLGEKPRENKWIIWRNHMGKINVEISQVKIKQLWKKLHKNKLFMRKNILNKCENRWIICQTLHENEIKN